MPLHALSDLSNVDSTSSPTISGLTITNNLSVYNQIYAPNQVLTLSSSVVTKATADKRYGNIYMSILSADSIVGNLYTTPLTYTEMGISLILNAGTYTVESKIFFQNLSGGAPSYGHGLSATDTIDIMGSFISPLPSTLGTIQAYSTVQSSQKSMRISLSAVSQGTFAYSAGDTGAKYYIANYSLKIYNNNTRIFITATPTSTTSPPALLICHRGSFIIARPTL